MNAFRMASLACLISSSVIGFLREIVDIFIERLNRFDRALALGPDDELQDAGMPEVRADAAADVVG